MVGRGVDVAKFIGDVTMAIIERAQSNPTGWWRRHRGAKWASLVFSAGLMTAAAQANATTYSYQSFAPPPGTPAGDLVSGYALNDQGQAIVNATNPNVSFNFTDVNDEYDVATNTYTPLPPAPGATAYSTVANNINDAGQIVGSYHAPGLEWAAYLYAGGVFTPLGVAGNSYNDAVAISNNGKYISGATGGANFISGYILHNGAYSPVAPVAGPTYDSVVLGVNNSGDAVGIYGLAGGWLTSNFLYSGGVYSPISLAGWTYTTVVAINDAGVIAGDVSNDLVFTSLTTLGFVDEGGVISFVSFPGATGTFIEDVNDRGQVTGYYNDAAGNTTWFIATPVPEPATWAMLILGMAGMGVALRRRRDAVSMA
jgi:hypothetical protein